MNFLDLTLPAPAENLACDEALLDLCEEERVEILRFWESRQHFVVVGYGNYVEKEVNVDECRKGEVPILRRCSGGGTVVQGPGCLSYSITLRAGEGKAGPLASVTGTNQFVMQRNRSAMETLLGASVAVQGCTDLTVHKRGSLLKFSGNAQRRRRNAVIFHGTFLYNFDVSLIDSLLRSPSSQPAYRASRNHLDFVQNISASAQQIRHALQRAWNAGEPFREVPRERIALLVRDQYGNAEWNLRR